MSHQPLACEKRILDSITRRMFKCKSAFLTQIKTCINFEEIFGCVPLELRSLVELVFKIIVGVQLHFGPLLNIHSGSSYFRV